MTYYCTYYSVKLLRVYSDKSRHQCCCNFAAAGFTAENNHFVKTVSERKYNTNRLLKIFFIARQCADARH